MLLRRHLREDRFGDVVVAPPVGCTLGVGELVDEMPAGFRSEPVRCLVNRTRIVDTLPTITRRYATLYAEGGSSAAKV